MDLNHVLNAAVGLLISGVIWMLKNIQARLARQDSILADQSKSLTIIQTVLMGPTGENGLRSDVRENTREIASLSTRLDKSGIA